MLSSIQRIVNDKSNAVTKKLTRLDSKNLRATSFVIFKKFYHPTYSLVTGRQDITDCHFVFWFRSLDGEGNFNWRFVFPLDFIPAENCILVQKKEHFWSLDAKEDRRKPKLRLQVMYSICKAI